MTITNEQEICSNLGSRISEFRLRIGVYTGNTPAFTLVEDTKIFTRDIFRFGRFDLLISLLDFFKTNKHDKLFLVAQDEIINALSDMTIKGKSKQALDLCVALNLDDCRGAVITRATWKLAEILFQHTTDVPDRAQKIQKSPATRLRKD